jgi:hypothetical protein
MTKVIIVKTKTTKIFYKMSDRHLSDLLLIVYKISQKSTEYLKLVPASDRGRELLAGLGLRNLVSDILLF